jgi:hypothetical protein
MEEFSHLPGQQSLCIGHGSPRSVSHGHLDLRRAACKLWSSACKWKTINHFESELKIFLIEFI